MANVAKRKMWISIVLGLLVAGTLLYVQTDISDSPRLNTVREVASVMMMPATLIVTLTRQIHNRDLIAITLLDFLFYSLCFYGLLSITTSRKQRS